MNQRECPGREWRVVEPFVRPTTNALELLVEASAAIGSTLDAEEAVESMQQLMLDAGAAACAVSFRGQAGPCSKTAGNPASLGDLSELMGLVQSKGESAVLERDDHTLVVVPLLARGVSIGALAVATSGGLILELRLIEELGRRLGAAIRSCNLYRDAMSSVDRRDDALASVAHDLRGPLSVVNLVLRDLLAVTQTGDATAARRSIELAKHATERMNGLLSDLLELAKVESDKPSLQLSTCQPRDLARETLDLLEPIAHQRNISLYCEMPDGLPSVRCDPRRITRVLANLVGNSIKFTPAGRHIKVEADVVGHSVVFHVHDAGIGIAAEDLPHVFERFCAGNPREGSVGLGLAIAKAFVEAHGGRIWADSELGVGTTMSFTLPCDDVL